jgi:hypothetical protein
MYSSLCNQPSRKASPEYALPPSIHTTDWQNLSLDACNYGVDQAFGFSSFCQRATTESFKFRNQS